MAGHDEAGQGLSDGELVALNDRHERRSSPAYALLRFNIAVGGVALLLALARLLSEAAREAISPVVTWTLLAVVWGGIIYGVLVGRRHHRERMTVLDEQLRRLGQGDLDWPI